MSKIFPYEILDLDPDVASEVSSAYSDDLDGFVQVGPEKWLLHATYTKELAQEMYNMKVRPDDIWICGVPRSGTTMLEEMAWLMVNGVDVEKGRNVIPRQRIPFFESAMLARNFPEDFSSIEEKKMVANAFKRNERLMKESFGKPERRVIKTHIPFCLLPPEVLTSGCKIIYTARNPKDALVSWYLLQSNLPLLRFTGDLKTFLKFYLDGLIIHLPYWSHIEQGWSKRHLPNFKFVFYEDSTQNLRETILDISDFLDQVLTNDQVDRLEGVLQFGAFKKYRMALTDIKNDGRNSDKDAVRKGKIVGYKDYMTKDMIREVDEWIQCNVERNGIKFPVL